MNGSEAGRPLLPIWVQTHQPGLLRLLRGILGAPDEAEDAAQEAWLSVLGAAGRIREGAPIWPFLRQTAVRKAIDRRRERARAPGPLSDDPVQASPFTPALDLSSLDAEQRACLLLFYWEGLSVVEIASELRVPVGTVKTWMFRARAQLRRELGEERA